MHPAEKEMLRYAVQTMTSSLQVIQSYLSRCEVSEQAAKPIATIDNIDEMDSLPIVTDDVITEAFKVYNEENDGSI